MIDQEFSKILNQSMPDYTVVENIGSGNYGSVYKCERDGLYYAIKIISVPANEKELQTLLARSDKEAVQAYLRAKVEGYRKEIMLMAELKGNRSIVNIEDYKVLESDNGLWYIVIRMELLTSLTLYSAKYEMDEEEVIRLGIDICDALSICEKHNIVHRDIKPENIMRHVEGIFKLGDFGVAKQLSKTTAGTIAGTEGFMAPEVYKGQEYNQTADIYSLGIVLYYYLNNKKMPLVAPNDRSLIAEQQAIEKRMTDKSTLPLPPKACENLGKIVVKACMYDKACRYRSAADMRADLVKVLNGESVAVDLTPSSERGTIAQLNETRNIAQSSSTIDNSGIYTPFTGDIVDHTSDEITKSRNKTTEAFDDTNAFPKIKIPFIAAVAGVAVLVLLIGSVIVFSGRTPSVVNPNDGKPTLSKAEMSQAYELGAQYYEQGNYESAIAELKNVSSKSADYSNAQNLLKAAREAYENEIVEKALSASRNGIYETALLHLDSGKAALGETNDLKATRTQVLAEMKQDYITKITAAEGNSNYSEAQSYLRTALSYLPDDFELKGLSARVEANAEAEKALQTAAECARSDRYGDLFATLEKAKTKVSGSTVALAKIEQAYAEYREEYLADILPLTEDPKSVSDYETAIAELEAAVKVLPEDSSLKTKLEMLKADKPVELFSLDWILAKYEWNNNWYDIAEHMHGWERNVVDNYGNKYNKVYYFNAGSYQQNMCGIFMSFDVENYSQLMGTVALSFETRNHSTNAWFSIRGRYDDGSWNEKLYETTLQPLTKPQTIDINLSEYDLIQIYFGSTNKELTDYSVYNGRITAIMSDFTLTK